MADSSDPPGTPGDTLPALGELSLSEERRAILAPKLASVLEQLRHLEDLERPELEPAAAKPERWDDDERR